MNDPVHSARNLEISCPVRSNPITYPKDKAHPELGNITRQITCLCLRGECSWWVVSQQKCAIVVIAERLPEMPK
jgi:hypothetical protein